MLTHTSHTPHTHLTHTSHTPHTHLTHTSHTSHTPHTHLTVLTVFLCFIVQTSKTVNQSIFFSELNQTFKENYLIPFSGNLVQNKQFSDYASALFYPENFLFEDATQKTIRAIKSSAPSSVPGGFNSFGRGIAITSNPTLEKLFDNSWVVICGYGFNVVPTATGSATTVQETQTSYAIIGLGRYNYITGTLDSSYGIGNRSYTILPSGAFPMRVVIQPAPIHKQKPSEQKIIIAGYTYQLTDNLINNNPYRFQLFVARYNWDGALDTTFNPKGTMPGIAFMKLPNFSATAFNSNVSNLNAAYANTLIELSPTAFLPSQGYALALDSENNVVVVGNANGMLLIARYLGNTTTIDGITQDAGTLDTTFNPNGYLYNLTKAFSKTNFLTGVITDPATNNPLKGTPGVFICSILGTPTFGNQGLCVAGNDNAYAVDIDHFGNIIVVGFGYQALPGNQTGATKVVLIKVTSTGRFDHTFGPYTNGTVITSLFDNDTRAYSVVLNKNIADPNYGKIIIAGGVKDAFFNSYVLIGRYLSNGYPDSTFGPGTVNGKSDPQVKGLVFIPVQTTSAPVSTLLTNSGFAFTNLTQNPSGLNMTIGIDFPSIYSIATAVKLQNDGKIVFCGYSVVSTGTTVQGLSSNFTSTKFLTTNPITSMLSGRITPTGSLDKTFNAKSLQPGITIIPIRNNHSYDDQAYDLVIEPVIGIQIVDDRIILEGQSKNNSFNYSNDPTSQIYAFAAAQLSKNGILSYTATFN